SPDHTDPDGLMWDTAIKLSDYHANPNCKCLVISWGATWCEACQQEQPSLVSDVGGDPNFCVLEILQEGPKQNVTASMGDVHDWAARYNQNYYVVGGTKATSMLWNGWGTPVGGGQMQIALPFSFIVNPSTMAVLGNQQGFKGSIHEQAMSLCGM